MIPEVWVMCIILCLKNIKTNSKVLNCVILIMMLYIMACNNMAVDEMSLFGCYQEVKVPGYYYPENTDFVYHNLLAKPAAMAGIPFGWFNCLFIAPALLLINTSLKRLVGNPSVVYFIFCVSSILLDTTLIRQFVANSIVVFGLQFLLRKNYSISKYVICVLIAAFIHLSSATFIILAFSKIKINRIQKKKFILFISAIMLLLTFINNQNIPGVVSFLRILGSQKTDYAGAGLVSFGWVFSFTIWIAFYLLAHYMRMNTLRYGSGDDLRIIEELSICILFSLIFVSFSMMSMVFSRLLRPVSWIAFIGIAYYINNIKVKKNNLRQIGFLLYVALSVAIFSLIFNYVVFSPAVTTIPVLNGNPFWINRFYSYALQ